MAEFIGSHKFKGSEDEMLLKERKAEKKYICQERKELEEIKNIIS